VESGAPKRVEEGSALVLVILATGVLVTLGLVLALVTTVETQVAANTLDGTHALAVAEAAAAQAMADLAALPSWDAALDGRATSSFFDGDVGSRTFGGVRVDLGRETALLLCDAITCAGRSPDAVTATRPWGRNNPRWRVFASGVAADLIGDDRGTRPGYAAVWIGDDSAENDADPLHDGGMAAAGAGSSVNPGLDVVALRVAGWGVRGSRRELELTVERADLQAHAGLRVRVWRELRGAVP
jgi:Tfp pilus assembly protein PilX